MLRRKRAHSEVGFNITPMIDMVFLLLIFFMVTSKLSNEKMKMDVNLPTSRVAKIPDEIGDRDIINVDADGNYYVANRRVTRAQLKAHLDRRFKANPPLKVYIRADAKTPFEVTEVIQRLAAEAGAVHILYGTYKSR